MKRRVVLLPGDGIGPEVVGAARVVLETLAGEQIELTEGSIGWGAFEAGGAALPAATLEQVRRSDGALLGAVSSPSHAVAGYRSPVVELRRLLDLFANLRPLRSRDGDVDLLVVRENTEGLYAGRERMESDGVAIAERVITRSASERIARVAFEQARRRALTRLERPGPIRRRGAKVTIVHKANVLRVTDGLFRETALAVARDYPEIEVEEQLVDSMAYRLVLEPESFDVLVAPNLYGDILSDLGAARTGGLGVAPSANIGTDFCLAEPVHGSAPDIAGRGIANPIATLRASALLLGHLDLAVAAKRLASAIDVVLEEGPRTPDLGGCATTDEVCAAVTEAL